MKNNSKIIFTTAFLMFLDISIDHSHGQTIPLVADLSEHLVAISTGFEGSKVLLFGSTDGTGDVVIVIRGPTETKKVLSKKKIGPIWINTNEVIVEGIPSFYRVVSIRSPKDFIPDQILRRYQIGLDNLQFKFRNNEISEKNKEEYKDAIIRLQMKMGKYKENKGNISLLANKLFRTELLFESNVPTGTYLVEVYLIRNNEVISAEIIPLSISKIGLGAEIYDFAKKVSAAYGLFAIIIAIMAGLFAEAAFRKI